jgi:hypothetical protein
LSGSAAAAAATDSSARMNKALTRANAQSFEPEQQLLALIGLCPFNRRQLMTSRKQLPTETDRIN